MIFSWIAEAQVLAVYSAALGISAIKLKSTINDGFVFEMPLSRQMRLNKSVKLLNSPSRVTFLTHR